MAKRLTQEEVITRFNKIHNKYDYSKVKYKTTQVKVEIICPEPRHGSFWQKPNDHFQGHGCPVCSNKNKTIEDHINDFKLKHGNLYDYSKVDYKGAKEKVEIICRKPGHGSFWQKPNNHKMGNGCPKCFQKVKLNKKDLVNDFNLKHNNRYDYSKMNYINNYTKIEIICLEPGHGSFWQEPYNHKTGVGCPKCARNFKESSGERKIKNILEENNIKYEQEYKFNDCINPETNRKLPFDFYLEEYNLAIEFDGKQHFKAVEYFGGEESFKRTQNRDNIKNKYCSKNNIKLLRISYNEEINSERIIKEIQSEAR